MQLLPKPTIVIFDMDGTTVRHLDPRSLAFMEWFDDSVFKITKLWSWIFEKHAQGPIITAQDIADPERPVRKAKSLIVHRTIHKLRNKPIELLVEPCPGVYAVLGLLKKHKIPLALASNGLGKGYGQDIVQKFGLDDYFSATVFREDIFKSKPHPEAILTALQKLGVKPTEKDVVWYIGDRHKDISAAKAAQPLLPCKIVPIAYGLNAAVAIIEKGYAPNHIMMNYRDIGAMLQKLLGDVESGSEDQSVMASG